MLRSAFKLLVLITDEQYISIQRLPPPFPSLLEKMINEGK